MFPTFPFLLPLFFSEAEGFRLLCCFAGEAARQPLSFGFAAIVQGTKTKAFTCPAAFKGQTTPSACSCFHPPVGGATPTARLVTNGLAKCGQSNSPSALVRYRAFVPAGRSLLGCRMFPELFIFMQQGFRAEGR